MKILKYILPLILLLNLSACQSSKTLSEFEANRIYAAKIEKENAVRYDSPFTGTLYFSGVSFIGNMAGNNSIEKTAPYAAQLYKEKDKDNPNINVLNANLRERIKNDYKGNIPIELYPLAEKGENAYGITLVINYENYTVTQIENYKRVIFSVMAQCIVFDFRNKSIVASFPFNVTRHYDNFNPTEANIKAEFAKIYGKKSYIVNGIEMNIFSKFIETLQNASIRQSYDSTIGIKDININSRALGDLQKAGFNTKADAQKFIAAFFNETLYKEFKVPVLPYTYESGIYVNLAESFENAPNLRSITLDVPNPDYPIYLDVQNMLTKRNSNLNNGRFIEAYAIKMNLNLKNSHSALLINTDYKYAYTKVFSDKTIFNTSVSTENYSCLVNFIGEIISQINKNSADKNFKNLIETCK